MEVRTVEIEFTEDTFGSDGDIRRNKGDHVYVDKMSAKSLVDVKKVAKRVADGPTLGTNKKVPRKRTRETEEAPATPEEEEEPAPPEASADGTDV